MTDTAEAVRRYYNGRSAGGEGLEDLLKDPAGEPERVGGGRRRRGSGEPGLPSGAGRPASWGGVVGVGATVRRAVVGVILATSRTGAG